MATTHYNLKKLEENIDAVYELYFIGFAITNNW